MWVYRSNDLEPGPRIIVFDYQAGRSGRHAQNFLEDWQGHLLVDDYGGYKALFSEKQTGTPCIELGCWAHARRKFFDLHQANSSPMAYEALQRIGNLYAIEAEGKNLTIEDRQQLREEKSLPELETLHDWLFTGSERAGQRAAAIQTLFGTAQLNGLNSSDWLKDILMKLPTWPNSRIDELLPLPPEFIEMRRKNN